MQKVFENESQGNKLSMFHGGYLVIETREPHTGYQLCPDEAAELVRLIKLWVIDPASRGED